MEALKNILKVWVINWGFVQKEIEAHRQLAKDEERPRIFRMAQKDILETMEDDLEKRANALADQKLQDLLTVVDTRLIVKLDARNGVVFIGEERPDDAKLASLKAEAEFFDTSELWKILHETPKLLAQKAIFMAGESMDDVKKGRSIIYALDTQTKILDTFKNYQKK